MLVSVNIFEMYKGLANIDPGRIAGQVVTGIGFLGAGAIIRSQERIRGLTTAAGIWVVCGIGLACGLGAYQAAILGTAFALMILAFFSRVEHKLLRSKDRNHP
jgi:putative Mg2+ transporter-C (MgtC) family protein